MQSLVRLAVSGMLLDSTAYRQQRDAPDGLRQGALLVLMVGLVLGLVGLVGSALGMLINPAPAEAARVIYEELASSDWFTTQPAELRAQFTAETLTSLVGLLVPSFGSGLVGLVATPVLSVLAWLLFGLFAHLMARVLGGKALLRQTLSCTALASGAQLFGVGQIFPLPLVVPLLGQVPSAIGAWQGLAVGLLGLLGNYLALREAHQLAPWRAFWATILGPLLLLLLFACGYCAFLFLIVGGARG